MLYNEKTTTLYKRSNVIVINNELDITPEITFHEQYATSEGEVVEGRAGSCALIMPEETDATFPLVHPITGDSLGEASFQNLQVMLHSLYLYTASIRDNPPVEVLPEPEPEPVEPVEPTEEEPTDADN
jgi:hypothetical protein